MLNTFFLQLFADAGTLVNATGNYVNAYTGDVTAFSGKNTLSGELKTFYDTELLENARIEMYYAQFGKKQALPRNGGKTVEWRKWNTFDKASELTEGVIPTGQKFGMSYMTDSIKQYGTYATISDQLELHAYDDVILGATTEMGASAAETQETLIRNALMTGTNYIYADKIAVSGGAVTTVTKRGDLVWNNTYHCPLTPTVVNKIRTAMIKNRATSINGKYVMVVHPSCVFDLRESKEWIEAHKYEATTEIFNGEIGELHGIRFIENPFAPVVGGANLAGATRNLAVNYQSGYSAGATSITFDGGTVAEHALKGRQINIGGYTYDVSDNTASAITLASPGLAASVADDAVIYPGEGGGEGTTVYANFCFGQDAFGIIDPDGGALQMIVKDKSEVGGPLEQFSSIGYKFETNGAKILYPERMINVMCTSSYSGTDELNY